MFSTSLFLPPSTDGQGNNFYFNKVPSPLIFFHFNPSGFGFTPGLKIFRKWVPPRLQFGPSSFGFAPGLKIFRK